MRFTKEEQLKLVKEAKEGSIEARNKIMVRMRPFIEHLVFKYSIKDDYLRDELASECLMEIPRLIKDFDTYFEAGFVPYAITSFKGKCKRYFRGERRNPMSSYHPKNTSLDDIIEIEGEEPMLRHEVIADKPIDFDSKLDIDIVLKDLSEKDKNILKLYYMEGMTLEEISLMYKTNKMNISRCISKSLKLLKNIK